MPVEAKLVRFIRSGEHGDMVLRLRHMPAPLLAHDPLERKAGPLSRGSPRRIGGRENPKDTAPADFTGGTIVARFRLNAGGEPSLITMFPEDGIE